MFRRTILIFLILILIPGILKSQCVIGQYEDEAPFRTWNIFGVYDARSTGMGESLFGLIEEPLGLLLQQNKLFSFSLSFISTKAEFFKYSFINTSDIYFPRNLKASYIGMDFAYGLIKFKDWFFGLSFTQPETYFRPAVEVNYSYKGKTYRTIKANFEGYLNSLNFSIGRRIGELITVGIGIHYVYGEITRKIEDDYIYYQVITTDNRSQKISGYYFSLIILANPSSRFKLVVNFRSPYTRYLDSESSLRYYSSRKQIEIRINGNARDEIKIPLTVGSGILYEIEEDLLLSANIIFFNWSNYRVTYFDEERKREFKNTIKIGIGLEYLTHLKIKNYLFSIPIRTGYIYDPQPMKNPNSYYNYVTMGWGIYYKKVGVDFGLMFGKENGSGNSLHASKLICNLNFQL
ncbi:hypothetical protein NLC82_03550 [Candidatus Aminicenantes bacterium AC-335-A11]|jgi:hypothetical protein|nr:hypothetical protein [SCandidatus Aminicenantes bacterium Aminicenantia_JdfR_composite]MCP2597793.1 hypothetical protein [Candidatus Aminicenantes bacterium AC-335-L06]MCP2618474.1 hypothetical protein [Candidatus Aminicenantes bacterium AC-335-A11]MCP2620518.1 hypothetical protein [Candidatus Aminicenantes bacterium AC-334-E05]